jgi:hypothetical protein
LLLLKDESMKKTRASKQCIGRNKDLSLDQGLVPRRRTEEHALPDISFPDVARRPQPTATATTPRQLFVF